MVERGGGTNPMTTSPRQPQNSPLEDLAHYGVQAPVLLDSCAFLVEGAWQKCDGHAELTALLERDRELFVALLWLQQGSTSSAVKHVTPVQAMVLVQNLGLERARYAALGIAIFRALRIGRSQSFPYDEFWTEALATGISTGMLSSAVQESCPLLGFLEGFLARVGAAVLASSMPQRYDGLAALDPQNPPSDEVLGKHFGVDVPTVSWALLCQFGMPESVWAPARKLSVRNLLTTQVVRADTTPEMLDLATIVGRMIAGDAPERRNLWPAFVARRTELELGREELNTECDAIVDEWWDWGELLALPVRTLPGFASLSDWNERNVEPTRFNFTEGRVSLCHDRNHGLDVLVVEGDPATREGTELALLNAGHTVRVARDGIEAMRIVAQATPQVVLAARRSEGIDGLELCSRLRSTDFGKRIYFVLSIDEESSDELGLAYACKINDFVPRSASLDVIRARLEAAHNFFEQLTSVDSDRRITRNHCEESRRIAARMKEDSVTDALTGLPNRRYAMDRLAEEWLRTKRNDDTISVIMLDIDFFKSVNDDHGHDVGDVVLRETAQVIEQVTRRNEKACRIGGEEFLIICTEASLSDAASCAERVRASIEAHVIETGDFHRNVTVSLGVAERTASVADLDELFKLADEAIYAAKESGRNAVALAPDNRLARFVGERLAG